jgi:hypothetical protein
MTEDPSKNTDRDKKGRFLTGNNGGGRPRGARSKLGEGFIEALAADFEEHGIDVIKTVRMRQPDVYLKIIKDILPREAVIAAFNIDVGKDANSDFPDDTTIESILDAVAREAGPDAAMALASMFGLEYSPLAEAAQLVESKRR